MAHPVTIVDVAPRDGLQSDGLIVPTEAKLGLIERIVGAGIRRIETTSFVNPKRVPQMADAAEVMAGLAARRAEVPADDSLRTASFIGLVLNRQGLDRALEAGCDEVNAVVVVSDTFSERNQGTTTEQGIEVWADIAAAAADAGVPASVTLAASFGCPYEGEVAVERLADVVARCVAVGGEEIALADSIGVAVPTDVRTRLAVARDAIAAAGTDQRLRVHFHNTRNTGLANVAVAVEEGVDVVDASLGGIGGCPFAPGATGNVPTEDVAYLLDRMGYETGIDLQALVDAVGWMQSDELLGRSTPGALARAGVFPRTTEPAA
ncbi:hydroxymethylglutaryl-CoA lyase [Dermatobacter hominis]|uniref:hydroxymethylglutaryl-CoA lyase n=1 Tax=Dermatobacter hominis TaxID=2884263 RepID=UPI001D1239CA|nr:hydroxymethylglutaryl-CoA lyase [Dermatobacter hominis]UDY36976.1 hydroxymethylglutaryl-CoA lyase [Dermatobacter hominis]